MSPKCLEMCDVTSYVTLTMSSLTNMDGEGALERCLKEGSDVRELTSLSQRVDQFIGNQYFGISTI
jgi:hypothetical protein